MNLKTIPVFEVGPEDVPKSGAHPGLYFVEGSHQPYFVDTGGYPWQLAASVDETEPMLGNIEEPTEVREAETKLTVKEFALIIAALK